MELAAYLTTVIAVCVIALGAMYLIVNLLGERIDDLGVHVGNRFDDMDRRFGDMDRRFDDASAGFNERFDGLTTAVDQRFDGVERRLDRLETQNDSLIGAVSDLGQRVTRLETRDAS